VQAVWIPRGEGKMGHTSDHHEAEGEKDMRSAEAFDKELLRRGENKPSGTAEDLDLNEQLTATYWG
jgi:hypothetical protein